MYWLVVVENSGPQSDNKDWSCDGKDRTVGRKMRTGNKNN